MLDLRTQLLLSLIRMSGRGFRDDHTVAHVRAAYAELNRRLGFAPCGGLDIRDLTIPTLDGASIGARLYRPATARDTQLPVLLYFHGGGWVIGDVDSFDHLTRFFARQGNLAVLSVDYRLAPEHRFPIAFEDGFAAFTWLQRHATELHLDAARIAVGGDSAGAAIAAALSTYAEHRGLERPAYQLLIYPPVDGSERFASRSAFASGLPLTTPVMRWFARHFLDSPADAASAYMMLLDAPELDLLPPTYLLAAGYDPLVDEGRAYAQRLQNAGVPIVYDLRPSLAHGFVNFPRIVPAARNALRDAIRVTATELYR